MNKRAPCSPLSATTETGGSLTRQRARLQGQSDQDLIVLDQGFPNFFVSRNILDLKIVSRNKT